MNKLDELNAILNSRDERQSRTTLNTELYEKQLEETQIPETRFNPAINAERDAAIELEADEGTHVSNAIYGHAFGAAAEMGLGIGMSHKLHRTAQALKWAKNIKRLSVAGIFAPEGFSTAGGLIGLGLSEAAIWGVSNFAGQTIRKNFGLQDAYSGGEMIASSVFGVGIIATGTNKMFKLADGVGAMKAWKGREVYVNGVKTFASGAALGLAESALRQEIEVRMNDDQNREFYDYLFSSLAGGSFNSLFSAWGRAGGRGRLEMEKSIEGAVTRLDKQIKVFEQRILDEPGKKAKFEKELIHLRQSREIMLGLQKEVGVVSKVNEDAEAGKPQPKNVEDPKPKDKPKKPVEEEAETTDTPDTAEKVDKETPKAQREIDLEGLQNRLKNVDETNLSTETPQITREGRRLYNDIQERMQGNIRKLTESDVIDNKVIADILEDVKFMRKLNVTVKDVLETTGGRIVQSTRRDARQFTYETRFSIRAAKEDSALAQLQDTLEMRLEGNKYFSDDAELGDDINDLFDDFIDIKPKTQAEQKRKANKVNKEEGEKIDEDTKPTEKDGESSEDADASPDVSDSKKAERIRKATSKQIERLRKELETLRQRFGDDKALDADGKPIKETKEKNPIIEVHKAKIRFYKSAERDAIKIKKLDDELDRLTKLEARNNPDEIKAEFTPKEKGETIQSRIKSTQDAITNTKRLLRKRLTKLQKESEIANKVEIFSDMNDAFYRSLETDTASRFGRGFRWLQQARQLSLIDQLPSVLAGVPTGVFGVLKQPVRGVGTFFANAKSKGYTLAGKMAYIEAKGAMKMLSDWGGFRTSVKRTWKENMSATDRKVGRMAEDIDSRYAQGGIATMLVKAENAAKRQLEAPKNLGKVAKEFVEGGRYWEALSFGVRGIQVVDEVFKRQMLKGRLWAEANKRALLEIPEGGAKLDKRAKELYDSAWKDSDGLIVLNNEHDFIDTVGSVREELLFAANTDNTDEFHKPVAESIIESLRNMGAHPFLGDGLNALMPYIGVPIRGVVKGLKLIPGTRLMANTIKHPYVKKIKENNRNLDAARRSLNVAKGKNKDELIKQIQELEEKGIRLQARRIEYNAESVTDTFAGLIIMGGAAAGAMQGDVTGSLTFLTPDQRKKSGLKPFKAYGSDYKAAMPFSMPMAVAADLTMFHKMKQEGLLNDDQGYFQTINKSITAWVKEMPLFSGVKAGTEIIGLDVSKEVQGQAVERLASSYFPIPAQARKFVNSAQRIITGDTSVQDLRGASFVDRIAYSVLGSKPASNKVDLLGNDLKFQGNFVSQNIMRQYPIKPDTPDLFQKVVASDMKGNLSAFPETLYPGVKMTKFVRDDGITLQYAYALELRKTRIKIGGSRINIEQAVNRLIRSPKWQKKYNSPYYLNDSGKEVNDGLIELNKLMSKFYTTTRKNLLKNKNYLRTFINDKEENLTDFIDNKRIYKGDRPVSIYDIFETYNN